LDEEVITTTPELSPAPEPEPLPELPPSEPDPELPSEPEPADPLTVVSVDELIDRLVQGSQDEETSEEAPPEETEPLPEEGDLFTEVDTGPMEIKGMDKLLTYVETIQQTLDHPALTTSFQDYTVTEGLLLLILLAAFAAACIRILKGGFQWLRW
jgi:hypothetical protein